MFFLNPRLAADVFDGEYIIANLDTGLYYNIQGIAVNLVSTLPFNDPHEVISAIADAFPDHTDVVQQELGSVLKELLAEDIVKQDTVVAPSAGTVSVEGSEYVPSRFNRYADMQDLLLLDPIHDVDEEGWTVQKEND